MASSLFSKRSTINTTSNDETNNTAEEEEEQKKKKNGVKNNKKNNNNIETNQSTTMSSSDYDSTEIHQILKEESFDTTRTESGTINVLSGEENRNTNGGGGEEPSSSSSSSETTTIMDTMSVTSNSDESQVAVAVEDSTTLHISSDVVSTTSATTNNNDTAATPIKWSLTLSTPSTSPSVYTPSSEISTSPQKNFHGLGLKYSIERATILLRTGKNCSLLLYEIASLHDDLVRELHKLCPALLENATANTPMEGFAKDVNSCVLSYASQTSLLGNCIRNHVAKPYKDNAKQMAEGVTKHYDEYTAARGKCATARKEALKCRRRYVDGVREVEGALANLRKGRRNRSRRRNKGGGVATTTTAATVNANANSDSNNNNESGAKDDTTPQEGVEPHATWEEELRAFGELHSLAGKCEAVIRASEEAKVTRAKYSVAVAEENAAVNEAQDVERGALDGVQCLEEERIVFLIGLLDRFLQDEKESLENMSLDLASVEPLDLADDNHRQEIPSSALSSVVPSTPTSLFMTPRRRAQSDDGPAINETRLLNLPDEIAQIRDNMKSLSGRQLGRLKTLKQVVAFNEGMASAIESFAEGLKSQLESSPSTAVMNKNEGANVLGSWNSAIDSLVAYANCADALAKQIREGNLTLQLNSLQSAEKDGRAFQEKEEIRWKNLCDAARVEAKAKSKHRQCVAELEKTRARLTSVEGEGSEGTAGDGDSTSGGNGVTLSPMKATTTKMDRHMNKAMGKMFSILPGGGEDVMNKVLTPQQRQAITNRQLDEALAKEEKGKESFEVAQSVKQQAVVSYETEAAASELKFKSDERNEWNEMQNSLVSCVAAMRNFREGQLESVASSIETVRERHLGSKSLDDVTRWTTYTEGRLKEQRERNENVDDSKDKEGQSGEGGFSLKVQLVESTNVKDLVRSFLDEKDVVLDDPAEIGNAENPGVDSSLKVTTNGDSTVIEETPAPALLPDVPPDPWIEKMDPIFSKKLKNVSIETYFSAAWLEDTPLYGPWLQRKGSFDVSVTDWEHASPENGDGFVNAWSKEKFARKRVIKFKFKRTTHLYIGPPVAGVTQTQYLIQDGNDRCVVMMTVEMDGIPYSDTFAVEVRWSARRVDQNDIAVDAGVFVRFTKSSMFASKIKSGTLKETSPIHLDLFEVIKKAIASGEEGGEIEDSEADTQPEEEANVATAVVEEEGLRNKTTASEIATMDETPPQVEGMLQQLVAALLSLTQNQQLLLAVVVLYFLTKMILSKKDPTADKMDDLARQVDDLTNEVRDMKNMLETILKMSEQNVARGMSCNDPSDVSA